MILSVTSFTSSVHFSIFDLFVNILLEDSSAWSRNLKRSKVESLVTLLKNLIQNKLLTMKSTLYMSFLVHSWEIFA